MPLDVEAFARGFIAALVAENRTSIQPKRPEQRRAFYRIYEFLGTEACKAEQQHDKKWLREVVRLRNRLAPGPTGAFDQFETALRDLQLSFTESPNPYYEDIVFTVSEPFARSTLERMSDRERGLVMQAAQLFVGCLAT
ncbi:MAG: hypothetical protein KGL11_01690 [Alphaproteobacteria bacterium]|nr:hypothetical protein [Alphaproteobacteria bacterium]